jgi:hypothetical protein
VRSLQAEAAQDSWRRGPSGSWAVCARLETERKEGDNSLDRRNNKKLSTIFIHYRKDFAMCLVHQKANLLLILDVRIMIQCFNWVAFRTEKSDQNSMFPFSPHVIVRSDYDEFQFPSS